MSWGHIRGGLACSSDRSIANIIAFVRPLLAVGGCSDKVGLLGSWHRLNVYICMPPHTRTVSQSP